MPQVQIVPQALTTYYVTNSTIRIRSEGTRWGSPVSVAYSVYAAKVADAVIMLKALLGDNIVTSGCVEIEVYRR